MVSVIVSRLASARGPGQPTPPPFHPEWYPQGQKGGGVGWPGTKGRADARPACSKQTP